MATISKIRLLNFKRFRDLEVHFKDGVNTIIGDNESGKSSILQAINIAERANVRNVLDCGIASLMNLKAITEFKDGDHTFERLPELVIEVYLRNCGREEFDGKNNSNQEEALGFYVKCSPNEEHGQQIGEILTSGNGEIPFDFYRVDFKMFSGRSYTYYNKPFKSIFIDSTESSHTRARQHLVSSIYNNRFTQEEIAGHQHDYKVLRNDFLENKCSIEGEAGTDGELRLKNGAKLEHDLTLEYQGIDIAQKGKGSQCEIKAAYALRNRSGDRDNVVLLEEPENHLSHARTTEFIDKIKQADAAQVILTSHSSLICSSLGLNDCIFLNNSSTSINKLSDLNPETASFFTKAPNHNILELILSEKVILVEGHAEYLLCQHLFKSEHGDDMQTNGIHLISVNGLSFKRYLEVANLLDRKVAVITDNDKSLQSLHEKYVDYNDAELVKVFSDSNEDRYTFEVCIYEDNKSICDSLFGSKRLSPQEWMLKNKSEAAFQIYESEETFTTPDYIKEAFSWMRS